MSGDVCFKSCFCHNSRSEYHKHTLGLLLTAESIENVGELVNEMW